MNREILLGTRNSKEQSGPVHWDPSKAISPHAIIVGSSGTGKTYRLRYIIGSLIQAYPAAVIHVLDVHGDVAPNSRSRVEFSESTEFGLNPLAVHNDPHAGGLRKSEEAFIRMLNRTTHKLGVRQEAVLRTLVQELYELNGYHPKRRETWNPVTNPNARGKARSTGKHPNVLDLERLAYWRMKNMLLGGTQPAFKALVELTKEVKKFQTQEKKLLKAKNLGDDIEVATLGTKMDTQITKCVELYHAALKAIRTGREVDELLRYDSFETIKTVWERLRALEATGLFKDNPPEFDPHDRVWAYDIKSLSQDEQVMFSDLLLERLFLEARSDGVAKEPRAFIIIDEAHKFLSPDPDHVINRMAREIRKFGVGIILVSQSFDHFPEDIIANTGLTMILGMHEMHQEKAARKLGLKRDRFSSIRPQQTALVQVRSSAPDHMLGSYFTGIRLAKSIYG